MPGENTTERLGESDGYGFFIMRLLDLNGWSVHERAPFAGVIDAGGTPGVMIIAAHRYADVPEIRIVGRSAAECAPRLLVEAGKYVRTIANARRRLAAA